MIVADFSKRHRMRMHYEFVLGVLILNLLAPELDCVSGSLPNVDVVNRFAQILPFRPGKKSTEV